MSDIVAAPQRRVVLLACPVTDRRDHRIFCEWDDVGAYISTLDPDFASSFPQMVEDYGPPSTVEFRAHDEGWIRGDPNEADGSGA